MTAAAVVQCSVVQWSHKGTSALTFSNVLLLDSTFNDVGAQAVNRTLVTVPEPGVLPLLLAACVAGLLTLRKRGAGKNSPATTRPSFG